MKKYSEKVVNQILTLWKSGKSYTEIANITHYDRHKISKYIRELYPNATKQRQESNNDVIGQRFDRLIITDEVSKDKWGGRRVLCLCDCGKSFITSLGALRKSSTHSCGCYHKDIIKSKQPWEVEYRRYKYSSDKRSLSFDLTLDEFKEFCTKECFYCGSEPQTKTEVGGVLRNGIDRVDGKNGYLKSNCVTCCVICNYMKRTLNQESFYQHIAKILEKHKKDIMDPLG